MTWLVTGGAGYIGSHVTRRLLAAGHRVVVYDDLSTGLPDRMPPGVPLVIGSVTDPAALLRAFTEHRVTAVVHLAARKSVPESLARPTFYYRENVGGLVALLDAMVATGVRRLLFSSSAAVYGNPPTSLVTEDTPPDPINPYGRTKLDGEHLIRAVGEAHGLSWIALRYFNVVGTDSPLLGDRGTTNLVPLILTALTTGEPLTVAGTDHPTPDGTPVRDYVHVADLADAHLAAAGRLAGGRVAATYNVGTGRGHSVRDVIACAERVTGLPVPHLLGPRRPHDPSEVVADPAAIAAALGWRARLGLVDMISSSWRTAHDVSRRPAPVV
ncbi:UDP-glucose 4-epimerase GalE [Longispora sp. K20-0274]|uniref:UDP-glucose 4-epimerase GalE n=1 Tax=Longispora sp. K20-0274 TaxID=3088255 RepID=UPI003999E076